VCEDRVLIAAGKSGKRRFGARISVVAGFVLKQLWLWITRRYHRHGYAGVSFGAPVSLAAFQRDHPGAPVEALGEELMRRISDEVPVLPVPMVARALLASDAPMPRAMLLDKMVQMTRKLDQSHVHFPREELDDALTLALRNLARRGLVQDGPDGIVPVQAERDVLAYYAKSIERFFAGAAQSS